MRSFVRLLRLDLTLQARSFIYPATVVSTAMICGFIIMLPVRPLSPRLTAFFVFLDPANIGLAFVGAMVLMEKAQGTLFALGVTPARPAAYVGSKMVTLTLVTFASSLVVMGVATGGDFEIARQVVGLTLCSVVAVLIGLSCVAGAVSMNHFVMRLILVVWVLYLPLLSYFEVLPGAFAPILAVIPSYAMLIALEAGVDADSVPRLTQLFAILYLAAWAGFGWRHTVGAFERAIVSEGR